MPKSDITLGVFVSDPDKAEVSDKYLDKYKKLTQQEEILDNVLLGDFIDEKYVIPTKIKHELIGKKKVISSWTENGLKALATIQDVTFEFQIEIAKFSETDDIAYLFLNENIYGKKMSTFIADYLDEKSDLFRDKAMKVFNVEMENDFDEKDAFENIYARIIALQQKNNRERRFVVETYSETYVLKMLKMLASCGPEGKKILEEYAMEVRAKGYDKGVVPELYIKLRKILDKTISKNGGMQELIKKNPQIKSALTNFVDPIEYYDKVVGKTGFLEVNVKQEKKEVKKEVKETSSSNEAKKDKKSSKPAAKGKDKPKSGATKKKDDKKKKVVGNFIPKPTVEKVELPQINNKTNNVTPKQPTPSITNPNNSSKPSISEEELDMDAILNASVVGEKNDKELNQVSQDLGEINQGSGNLVDNTDNLLNATVFEVGGINPSETLEEYSIDEVDNEGDLLNEDFEDKYNKKPERNFKEDDFSIGK